MKDFDKSLEIALGNGRVKSLAITNTHVAILEDDSKDSFRVDIVAITGCECRTIDDINTWGLTCLNFRTQETGWYTADKIMAFKRGDIVFMSHLDLRLFDKERAPSISIEDRMELHEFVLTNLLEMPQ